MNNAVALFSLSLSLSNLLYLRPPSHSPLLLLCFSYSTFLEVQKASGPTQGSKILIKIWLTPIRYDSSGGGCYREACGLGGAAEVLSQTGPLMWCDFATWEVGVKLQNWTLTGTGRWWAQLLSRPWCGEARSTCTRIHSSGSPFSESTNPTHTLMNHTLPPLYYRLMAPKVGSWNCHGPTQDCKRPCSILRYCLISGIVS